MRNRKIVEAVITMAALCSTWGLLKAQAAEVGSAANSFAGQYRLTAGGNETVLVIQELEADEITGTFSSTTGVEFQLTGEILDDVIVGICFGEDMAAFFEGRLMGNELQFTLMGIDDNNMPDADTARTLNLPRSSGTVLDNKQYVAPAAEPGLTTDSNPSKQTAVATGGNSLIGTWTTQGNGESVTLIIYENSLELDGSETGYSLLPDVIHTEEWDFPYRLRNNVLEVTFPNNIEVVFRKTSDDVPVKPAAKVGDLISDKQVCDMLVANGWCSFSYSGSSSSDLSYGTSNSGKLRFFSDGSYARGDYAESSHSDPGFSYTSGDRSEGGGRWEVRNMELFLDGDLTPLELNYNSNDAPILLLDGTEHSRCE